MDDKHSQCFKINRERKYENFKRNIYLIKQKLQATVKFLPFTTLKPSSTNVQQIPVVLTKINSALQREKICTDSDKYGELGERDTELAGEERHKKSTRNVFKFT